MLNFFTFESKVHFKERRTSTYGNFYTKIRVVRFAEGALDGCDCAKLMGHNPMTRVLLLDFCHLIFIRVSLRGHVLLHDSLCVRLNRDRPMSLMRSTAHDYTCALIVIRWTGVHEIDARHALRFHLTHHVLPGRLKMLREKLVPRGENKGD